MINKKDRSFLQRFGMNLKRIRDDKGLSLRDLSYLCEIDNSKISKIEHGSVNVTVRTILQLSEALEMAPMELLRFENED